MFSKRINKIDISPLVKYNDIVKQREKEGIHFYKANIGQPNIDTDKTYYNAISNYKPKINSYTDSKGIDELRTTICDYYNNKINFNKYISDNIIITQGASDGIIKTLYSICDVNDEVVILEPFFSDYKMYCNLLEINIKTIDYFDVDYESLTKIVTDKTKAILFANPNNPDGDILTKRMINCILKVAEEKNIFVISDEVYNEILFVKNYNSLIKYDYKNIVIVDSASKKLNNCGSRIGFIISKNEQFISKINILNDSKISISNIEQIGVRALLLNYKNITEKSVKIYKRRLNKIVRLLKKNNIKFIVPKGGMSILIELSISDCEDYVLWLISKYSKNNRSLIVTPAKDFYLSNKGKNKIRLSLTIEDDEIEEVIDILNDSYLKYMEEN